MSVLVVVLCWSVLVNTVHGHIKPSDFTEAFVTRLLRDDLQLDPRTRLRELEPEVASIDTVSPTELGHCYTTELVRSHHVDIFKRPLGEIVRTFYQTGDDLWFHALDYAQTVHYTRNFVQHLRQLAKLVVQCVQRVQTGDPRFKPSLLGLTGIMIYDDGYH